MTEPLPEGYVQPVPAALITPVLVAGVPRAFAILNGTAMTASVSVHHQILIAVPLGLGCTPRPSC